MRGKLLLLGAAGTAKKAIESLREQDLFSTIALLDNFATQSHLCSYPIIGKCDDLEKFKLDFTHAFICISEPEVRMHFLQKLISAGFEIPNIIHPRAYVCKSASIGVGTFVNALASIQSDSKIGDGCIVETGAIIEHDNEVGECVTIAPNASTTGNVKIGDSTFMGVCSCIINHVTVGKNVIIAAGATVIANVPDNVMVAGCPALIKKQRPC